MENLDKDLKERYELDRDNKYDPKFIEIILDQKDIIDDPKFKSLFYILLKQFKESFPDLLESDDEFGFSYQIS